VSGQSPLPCSLVVVLGPTASGKSSLALAVAKLLHGEIVSADSMQVYRGLDIGTAKPTAAERAAVPHHMIDVVAPTQDFSVAQFQVQARQVVHTICSRGHLPIVVGGTGLYVRALLYDYDFSAPGRDPELRARLATVAREQGLDELRRQLTAVDPIAAGRIHANDERRLIRALEVWHLTRRPISDSWSDLQPRYDALKIGIAMPRVQLGRRIDERVDIMITQGLVDEVSSLMARGFSTTAVAGQALGYKEIVESLSGRLPLDAAIAAIKRATRQYSKRQMTWFRREGDVHWLAGPGQPQGDVLSASLALIKARWGTYRLRQGSRI